MTAPNDYQPPTPCPKGVCLEGKCGGVGDYYGPCGGCCGCWSACSRQQMAEQYAQYLKEQEEEL